MHQESDFIRTQNLRARLTRVDLDLRPAAKITAKSRVAGIERIDVDGKWWKGFVETYAADARGFVPWFAVVKLDDGQRTEARGSASCRQAAEVAGRAAVTDMMVLWAEVRTRVRKCRTAVPATALALYKPPLTQVRRSWTSRLLSIFWPLYLK